MRYIVSGEFTEITETSGTIQNTSKINVVEVSDTNEKGSGIMLYPLDRVTFSKSIYARCVDGGGAEVRVVPFEVGTQGGGEQGTTPSGGGSGIAFAGMILGTESSTVDGGLWYGVTDGLPVVKMNYKGGDFLIDTHFDGDNMLIGDVLYLGEHRFKLTGFADGLTFSDNNFYAGGDSTPIGSVSSFAFQFTDAGALNVAEGGTISIAQLDTDAVNLSLDLDSLNSATTPWKFANRSSGTYTYTVGTPEYSKTAAASYTKTATGTDQTVLTLNIAQNLTPSSNPSATQLKIKMFAASEFIDYIKVDEIRNTNGSMKEFVVTIMSDGAIKYNNAWIDTISATTNSNVKVTVKFASNLSLRDNGVEEEATFIRDKDEGGIDKGTYTYTSEQYVIGYKRVDGTSQNLVKYNLIKPSAWLYADNPPYKCTIEGLATGLKLYRIGEYEDAIKYDIYTGDTYNAENIVGYILDYLIKITDARALDIPPAAKSGQVPFAIKLGISEMGGMYNRNFYLQLDSALTSANEAVAEGFTRQSDGSYKYHVGSTGWQFKSSLISFFTSWDITIKPAEVIGIEGLNLVIRGLTLTDPELFVTLSSGSNSAANVTRENEEIVCSINYNATAPSSPTLTGADAADFTLILPN